MSFFARLSVAFGIFFRALGNAGAAEQAKRILAGEAVAEPKLPPPEREKPQATPAKPAPAPARSEALSLLSALQREARFVDFLQEQLGEYTDAQIGAVARDLHRDCGSVLQRMFALKSVVEKAEGDPVELPAGFEAARYQLTGKVQGEPPFKGRLVHHGWEATKCEVPAWTGAAAAARVVAPAEVEL
jgi:hypothetical protein